MIVVEKYLVEEAEREYRAVHMLATMPYMAEKVLSPSGGLDPYFCWYLLRAGKHRLRASLNGDIDLLVGPLEWNDQQEFLSRFEEEKESKTDWHPTQVALLTARKLADKGGIKWPPSTNPLVAIEAKCAYLCSQAKSISRQNLKSTKTSSAKVAHTRAQIVSLLRMGFDRVILLDIIANPPVSGIDGQAWFTALDVADLSRQALSSDLQNRLPANSPAGHYVWSIGSVVGGNETQRGSGSPIELQPTIQNPLLLTDKDVKACRSDVQKGLQNEFEKLPAPTNLRVVFVSCQKCGQIHSDLDACKMRRD